jgi:molybdenum cofactor guanylyltransferase
VEEKVTIKKANDYFFHPYEIGFCGYSNAGKTTLVTKLIKKLSQKYSIGYVKHDAHKFTMDHEGKDTDKAWKSNASQVFISDLNHSALISSAPLDSFRQKTNFINCDMTFIEGYKKSSLDKIILIDKDKKILKDISNKEIDGILAFVGEEKEFIGSNLSLPYFQRDDLEGISLFVEEYFLNKVKEVPLYGLVLAGGYSKRMQQDKALLTYNGKAQVEHCLDLLSEQCKKVFVSKREEQDFGDNSELPIIKDRFLDFGPMSGILSAMISNPHAAWMVIACDLPLITKEVLGNLIENRDPFKMATAYMNLEKTFPEPLCAIYEPKMVFNLFNSLALGKKCPKKILHNSLIKQVPLPFENALMNVNTPQEYDQLQKEILTTC